MKKDLFWIHKLNKQTNQIRLDKTGFDELINEKGEIYEKIAKHIPKFQVGIMVASGILVNGPGRLVFVAGTMNWFYYRETLDIFKEDKEKLDQNLYFQEDNAPCRVGEKLMECIHPNLQENS